MAFPIIPVLAAYAIAAYAMYGTKKKKKTPTTTTPDEGEIFGFVLEDFPANKPLELDVRPGDILRFEFATAVGPHSWARFTEAVQGSPVVEVEETVVMPDAGSTSPARYIADVLIHGGPGTVKLDFMLTDDADGSLIESRTALIRIT